MDTMERFFPLVADTCTIIDYNIKMRSSAHPLKNFILQNFSSIEEFHIAEFLVVEILAEITRIQNSCQNCKDIHCNNSF